MTGARWHGGRASHCWLHMDAAASACYPSENVFEVVDSGFEQIVFCPCNILVAVRRPLDEKRGVGKKGKNAGETRLLGLYLMPLAFILLSAARTRSTRLCSGEDRPKEKGIGQDQ